MVKYHCYNFHAKCENRLVKKNKIQLIRISIQGTNSHKRAIKNSKEVSLVIIFFSP